MSKKLKPIDKNKLSPLNRRLVEGMEQIFGVTFVDATPQQEQEPREVWHVLADEKPPEDVAIILEYDGFLFYAMREINEVGDILHYQAIEGGPTCLINLMKPIDPGLKWRLFDEFDE